MYGYTSLVTASLLHVFFFLLVIDATNSQALPQVVIGFQQSSYMVNEGDGSVQVCAELMSGQLGETDFVRLRISTNRIGSSDSAAQPGSDFQNLNEIVVLDQENMNEPICRDVGIMQDNTSEEDENFRVSLRRISSSGVDVSFNPGRTMVFIADSVPTIQQAPPVIMFAMLPPPVSGNERRPGFVNLPIQVSVSPITAQLGSNIVVMVGVLGGTATNEADYDFSVTGAEDMVTFESGTKNAAIKNAIVQIQDDTLVEGTEMIVLLGTLPNVNDQNIASFRQDRDRVNFSILDNDVTLAFQQVRYAVNEGAGRVRVCVQITAGQLMPGDILSFGLELVGDTATADEDYMDLPNGLIITFRQGNMNQPQCLDILIIDDDEDEDLFERLVVQLDASSLREEGVNLVNYRQSVDVFTNIVIIDNDEPDGGGDRNGTTSSQTVIPQPTTMPAMMPTPTPPGTMVPTPTPGPGGPGCPPLSCIICNNYGHGSYNMTTTVEPTTSDLSDPCEQQPCDTNAVCTAESGGSFTCVCIPPFVGNGFTCSTIDIGPLQTPPP